MNATAEMRTFAEAHSSFEWVLANSGFGSHIPILLQCIVRSSNPVLEIGCGEYSTPILHLFCPIRHVVSIDDSPDWIDVLAAKYGCRSHEFACVRDFDLA